MISYTSTHKVMSMLSMEDWESNYNSLNNCTRKSDVDTLGDRIIKDDYRHLESLPLRVDKFIHLGDNESNIQFKELKAISKLAQDSTIRSISEKGRNIVGNCLSKIVGDDSAKTLQLSGRMMVNHAGGVLENATIALHPLYGFPIIPGSALKGIARHHAWTEWNKLMQENNPEKANELAVTISRVFGFPTGDAKPRKGGENREYLDDFLKKANPEADICSGSIDFIMAIPADDKWKLVVDLVNPHGGNDYTEPVPSFYLAVDKGARFQFFIRANSLVKNDDKAFAFKHLALGLAEQGAGAKGTAGYGRFDCDSIKPVLNQCFSANLVLATPAFMGGADLESAIDTDLRVPALRGLLRWWWRTLYADKLSISKRDELEAAIWGDTGKASLIQLSLNRNISNPQPELFDVKDRFNLKANFANAHGLDVERNGILYMSYGMCEKDKKRYYLEATAEWELKVSVRNDVLKCQLIDGKTVSSEFILDQARMALSLLCQFGGIGSRARKGFGSICWNDAWQLSKCQELANKYSKELFSSEQGNCDEAYSWSTAIVVENVIINTSDPWTAIDRLGLAVKDFASKFKHRDIKATLGLPRQIHGPRNDHPLGHQNARTWQPPQQLSLQGGNRKKRLASPVWYHFARNGNEMLLNIVAFPSGLARNLTDCKDFLGKLVASVKDNVVNSQTVGGKQGVKTPAKVNRSGKFKAVIIAEKTKKGGLKARCDELNQVGAIINWQELPKETKEGDEINVTIAINDPRNCQFRWQKG